MKYLYIFFSEAYTGYGLVHKGISRSDIRTRESTLLISFQLNDLFLDEYL